MKHIIKPLLGTGKKVVVNGAEVAWKTNGKNGLNGNGNGSLIKSYAKEQRALAKANLKNTGFTQVVEKSIENPNDLALESARKEVRRKFTGLTERSLPITDRIIDLDEVDTQVKNRYRAKLREFYNNNNQSLKGYREEIGLL